MPNDIERLQNCSFKSFLSDFQGFFSAGFYFVSSNLFIGLFFGCFSSGQLGKEDSLFYCYWKSEVIGESFKDLKICRGIFSSLHIKLLCNSKQKIKRKARKRKKSILGDLMREFDCQSFLTVIWVFHLSTGSLSFDNPIHNLLESKNFIQ